MTKTKDLTLKDSFYHADADAYILRGVVPATEIRPEQHIIAWMIRSIPGRLYGRQSFSSRSSARKAFQQAVAGEDIPAKVVDGPDEQKERVYAWENLLLQQLAPETTSTELTERQSRKLLRKIARDAGIDAPTLIWTDRFKNHGSEYDDDTHTIYFSHRDKISLLHEMAHAIHSKRTGEKIGPDHSPGFVWVALDLYYRDGGIDLAFLLQSAACRNILGDIVARDASDVIKRLPRGTPA